MYIEEIMKDRYRIYINNKYFAVFNTEDKNEISNDVKKLVFKIDHIYNLKLSGFYKMHIYLNKKVGIYRVICSYF